MLQPTALNFIVVAMMFIVFSFLWRMASAHLVDRNPDSPVGKAMGAIYS